LLFAFKLIPERDQSIFRNDYARETEVLEQLLVSIYTFGKGGEDAECGYLTQLVKYKEIYPMRPKTI
jgi:hypothetical protein